MEVVLCTFLLLLFLFNNTVTLDCQGLMLDPVDADCVFLNSRSYVRNSVRMPALSSKAGAVPAHSQAHIMFVQIFSLSTKRPHAHLVYGNIFSTCMFCSWLLSGLASFCQWQHSVYLWDWTTQQCICVSEPSLSFVFFPSWKYFLMLLTIKWGLPSSQESSKLAFWVYLTPSDVDLQCLLSLPFCSTTVAFLRAWLSCCITLKRLKLWTDTPLTIDR